MQRLAIALILAAALPAIADTLKTHGYTAGPSVPTNTGYVSAGDGEGVSRLKGGEHLTVKFATPAEVSEVKITAYSTSRKGTVLIRGLRASLNGKACKADLRPLSGKNLADGESAAITLGEPVDKLDLRAEGFKNDDASLVFEFSTSGDIEARVSRHRPAPPPPSSGDDGHAGGCINGGQFGMCLDGSICCTGLGCGDGSTCSVP